MTPIHRDARLRECNYGTLNGCPVVRLEGRRRQHVDEPYPGGESYRAVVERVRSFLNDVAPAYGGATILVIGHAATKWALDHLLSGFALEELVEAPFEWQEGWLYVFPSGVRL